MYKGKEVCQGCGKSGIEIPRPNKYGLCKECQSSLEKGQSAEFDSGIKYVLVFQHYYAYQPRYVNDIVHKLLESLHNPFAKHARFIDCFRHSHGSNGKRYNIDSRFYTPLKELFAELSDRYSELEEEQKAIPNKVRELLEDERNKIYNEGIAKGRNLLSQLNAGEIKLSDFEVNCSYNKNHIQKAKITFAIKINKGSFAGQIVQIETDLDEMECNDLPDIIIERGYLDTWCNKGEYEVVAREINIC